MAGAEAAQAAAGPADPGAHRSAHRPRNLDVRADRDPDPRGPAVDEHRERSAAAARVRQRAGRALEQRSGHLTAGWRFEHRGEMPAAEFVAEPPARACEVVRIGAQDAADERGLRDRGLLSEPPRLVEVLGGGLVGQQVDPREQVPRTRRDDRRRLVGGDARTDLLGPELPPACVADAIGAQQRWQRDPMLRERLRPSQEVGGGLDRFERDVAHQAVEHHRAIGLGHRPDELGDLRGVEPGDLGQDPRCHIGRQRRQIAEHRGRDVAHVRADRGWRRVGCGRCRSCACEPRPTEATRPSSHVNDNPREADMSKHLDGKVAVITGAGSGIGRETALLCARRGASLAICDVNEPGLEETAARRPRAGSDVLDAARRRLRRRADGRVRGRRARRASAASTC